MNAPLSPEREQEIRRTHPGPWYDGPWTQDYVEPDGDEPAYCRVVHHESGTTLATLPDFAGPIALFIADAHDAVPELLAELDRVRAERDQYATELDGICLTKWEDEQAAAEHEAKIAEATARPRPLTPPVIRHHAPPNPFGCRRCGDPAGSHGLQWVPSLGMHRWERPTKAQTIARMRARLRADRARRNARNTTPGETR